MSVDMWLLPSDLVQKYRTAKDTSQNKCRTVILLLKEYPYAVPKVVYSGKTYHHLNVAASTTSVNSIGSASSASTTYMEDDLYIDFAMMNLDPLKWKEQDHYMLLGLSMKRYEASENDIKKAYRKMILKYHPDKKTNLAKHLDEKGISPSPVQDDEDSVFKCIQKAYEILSDPEKRRQYDSVDTTFDESIPKPINPKKLAENSNIFFEVYKPVFFRNARFSKIRPVPDLGDAGSSRDHIEAFYDFWYNFESTRSFEYMDEEETEHAESRYDKRYLDKKNKAARVKRKTEDNTRLRKLVEQAMGNDPRLKAFKEHDKAEKERIKIEKKTAMDNARKQAKTGRAIPGPVSAMANTKPTKQEMNFNKVFSPNVQPTSTLNSVIEPLEWTIDEMKWLITGANKIPGGSLNRWEKIAEFVNHHANTPLRPTDEIVSKCHELKHIRDVEALQKEYKKKVDPRVYAPTEHSVNPNGIIENNSEICQSKEVATDKPWTKEEQTQLENALRLTPASTANRWDEIAKQIPTRTKAQVVARFKELANALRQKKETASA